MGKEGYDVGLESWGREGGIYPGIPGKGWCVVRLKSLAVSTFLDF